MTTTQPSYSYFLVNPAHEPIVKGERTPQEEMRRHNRRWQVMLYSASVIAVLFVAILFAVERLTSLEARGETTFAVITRHAVEDQSAYDNIPRTYYLEFRYEVGGITYNGQQVVNTGQFTALRDGDRVRIAYLPDDPRVAEIVTSSSPTLLWIACVTGLGIAMVGMFTLYQFTQQRRYQRGQVIQGEILRAETKMDTQRKIYVQLQYVFLTPQGVRIERSHILSGEKWTRESPPPPGTPVFIQYANDREFSLL